MSLRDCREKNNLSIIEVAKSIGVDRRTYYLWESQNKDIPSSMLIKLALLFNCSINDLLDFYPDSFPYEKDILELKKKIDEMNFTLDTLIKKIRK